MATFSPCQQLPNLRRASLAWQPPAGPTSSRGTCSTRSLKPSSRLCLVGLPGCRLQPHAAFREWFSTVVTSRSSDASPEARGDRRPSRRDYLEARQVSLYQLFDGQDFKFDIPAYQRPYSWGTKQMHEMLQDFLASYHSKTEYFLGAIVTVKSDEDPHGAYQVIDGQQRLTSLLIMLAFVHAWAKDSGNVVLEQRIKQMLYIEPDPLDPDSQGRFRLQLRCGDDAFFLRNMLSAYLPLEYCLSGVAAISPSPAPPGSAAVPDQGPGAGTPGGPYGYDMTGQQQQQEQQGQQQVEGGEAGGPRRLENESWWRMYDNAGHLGKVLSREMSSGLDLSSFMFHVLRNCYVVLMNARDEAASFRIFSTINSRGMDLSMVDKLKADLLEVLDLGQRRMFAAHWSEMEDILGRASFHKVFDYMHNLAAVFRPEVQHMTVLEHFSLRRNDPVAVAATIHCALQYARILLQLRQCRFEVTPTTPSTAPNTNPALPATSRPPSPSSATRPMQLLAEDEHGGIVAAWDDGGPASCVHTYGAIRSLERQARHMALFTDDVWVPVTLDFFQQVDDMDVRTKFLQAVETLQLYLELCCDAAQAVERWRAVAQAVVRRESDAQDHLPAIFSVMGLSVWEKHAFRSRLNQKDLLSSVPHRTLAHLLLRAEGGAVSASPTIDFPSLRVDKIVPANPPDGSQWRRTKLGSPGAAPLRSSPTRTGSVEDNTGPGAAGAAQQAHGQTPRQAPRRSPSTCEGAVTNKYWFEVQRTFWHGKLGNLILLPSHSHASAFSIMNADYDVKAAYFKSCDVEALLPEWSGSVVSGRYSRNRFSFDECKTRHADLLSRLIEVFHLAEDDNEDPLQPDDEYWPAESVY